MTGFYMKRKTGLKWVKQKKNLIPEKAYFNESELTSILMNESWRHFPVDVITMNFLTPGVHKKVRHIQTNLQVKAVGLFKYGWPFSFPLKSKTIIVGKIDQS